MISDGFGPFVSTIRDPRKICLFAISRQAHALSPKYSGLCPGASGAGAYREGFRTSPAKEELRRRGASETRRLAMTVRAPRETPPTQVTTIFVRSRCFRPLAESIQKLTPPARRAGGPSFWLDSIAVYGPKTTILDTNGRHWGSGFLSGPLDLDF